MSSNPGTLRLFPAQISALPPRGKPYDVADPAVPNLLLRVGPTGTKRWLFRYQWKRKQTRISIGRYPDVGLAEARERAIAHQNQIRRGIDPRATERDIARRSKGARASVGPTSASLVAALIGDLAPATPKDDPLSIPKPEDPADKHSIHFLAYEYVEFYVKRQCENSREVVRILTKDALPYWRKRDARTISSREIIERLDAIVARGAPVMANRTAQILAQMFTFGIHRSIVTNSPVNLLFPPGGSEDACDRVLTEAEIYRFIHGLLYVAQSEVRRRTLMVMLLTAVRRGSLAQAKWTEFDFNTCEWHVPAEHDKERRSHIVPLTGWAVEELLALKRLSRDSVFVLPRRRKNRTDQPSSAQLISRSVKRLQGRFQAIDIAPFTPHDIRRTVRTQLAMLGTSEDIAERILNHSRGEIVNTYDLHKYIAEKRIALKRWECKLRSLLEKGAPKPSARELIRNWLMQNRNTRLTRSQATVPRINS